MSQGLRDFLAAATPGAGRTTFALRIALELIGAGVVDKSTVVCPTEHLKDQWTDVAAQIDIRIDPAFINSQGRAGSHYDGVAVTYAQIIADPPVHATRTRAYPTPVVLDEIHHARDALSWGDGVREAFADTRRHLALTDTPFRSNTSPIPFVRYEEDADGIHRSKADFTYGYGDALRESVVRPVLFISYSGQMSWRTSSGGETSARLGEPLTKNVIKRAWRTALDPEGERIPVVLRAADLRLEKVRQQIPDAGGLVITSDQIRAHTYTRHLRDVTGRSTTVVLPDDADALDHIDTFHEGDDKWMVAVRMVSEGVDIPRLCVGVYATNTSTSLFFTQAVGRSVRVHRHGETATVFIPSVLPLLDLAGQMELERDHAPDWPKPEGEGSVWNPEDAIMVEANREEKVSDELLKGFEVLGADAEFGGVLFDGAVQGQGAEVGSEEEQEYLGTPGLLDAEQVTTLLRARQAKQTTSARKRGSVARQRKVSSRISGHRVRAAKRKELQHLIVSWSRRSGDTHVMVHSQLRNQCGGPGIAQTTTK